MLDVLPFRSGAANAPFTGTAALGSDLPPQPRRALTVLIPFFNEAGNIQPLIDEVHTALNGVDYEIVCVNDCSSDATGAELVVAKGEDRPVERRDGAPAGGGTNPRGSGRSV